RALAEFHGVSESYLLKHLKALVAAGLFVSVPGPKGGYRLARPAQKITLLDVVCAVEGDEPAFRCTEIRQRGPAAIDRCAYRRPCVINKAMQSAETAWRKALKQRTLADIAAEIAAEADKRIGARTEAWLSRNERKAAS